MQTHDTTAAPRPLAMVIDDDDGLREAMVEILEGEGFVVREARNGLEALNLLATSPQKPALICLDMVMPVLDGWTFCRVRERTSTLQEIPVVAISGSPMSGAQTPVRVDAILQKPFAAARLAWLATRMIGRNAVVAAER
jgi:CheY-like chemotaxis protein